MEVRSENVEEARVPPAAEPQDGSCAGYVAYVSSYRLPRENTDITPARPQIARRPDSPTLQSGDMSLGAGSRGHSPVSSGRSSPQPPRRRADEGRYEGR